jgi:hypothetical protein
MDKFDKVIQNAKALPEPSERFVETTMQEIKSRQPRRRWQIKIWAPILAGGFAVIALIFVALPSSNHNVNITTTASKTNSTPTATQSKPSTATKPTTTTNSGTSAAANGSPSAGTDNASLESQLNSVNGEMNQENSDQGDANSALNDSQQEITVPTD